MARMRWCSAPQPREQPRRHPTRALAQAQPLQRGHREEALAELARREARDHHVPVRVDAHEAVALEPGQRLHDRDAAHGA